MPYRLQVPKVPAGQTVPLILFLHGYGERGSDGEQQVEYPFFHEPESLFGSKTLARHPAIVVAPQDPAADKWIEISRWGDLEYRQKPAPTAPLQRAFDLVAEIRRRYPVDPRRIYVTGLSMGGFGSYDLLARHPDVFAAGVIVCGGGDAATVPRFKDIPLYIFHGAKDQAVPVAFSQRMADALRRAGASPHLKIYPAGGHDVWNDAYLDQDMIAWLFAARRGQ
jgi:predicted peptidase